MQNYDMRISQRKNMKQEYLSKMTNACEITPVTARNIPCVKITSSEGLNHLIRNTHIKLLQMAMIRTDGHKYDEVGILMELTKPYNSREFMFL